MLPQRCPSVKIWRHWKRFDFSVVSVDIVWGPHPLDSCKVFIRGGIGPDLRVGGGHDGDAGGMIRDGGKFILPLYSRISCPVKYLNG
jgi:hypothetical protein